MDPDVRDVVGAYRLLIENGQPGEVYNVSSGRDVAMSEVAAQLLNAFNHANFLAVAGTTSANPALLSNYQLTALQGQDTSRTIQLEVRFRW